MKLYLAPSDLVCLGLTCKEMFFKINYQVIDLSFAQYSERIQKMILGCHLPDLLFHERHMVLDRLDRDRLNIMARQERTIDGTRAAVCSVCLKMHPQICFSEGQLRANYQRRKCLASTAEVRICEGWSVDFVG